MGDILGTHGAAGMGLDNDAAERCLDSVQSTSATSGVRRCASFGDKKVVHANAFV